MTSWSYTLDASDVLYISILHNPAGVSAHDNSQTEAAYIDAEDVRVVYGQWTGDAGRGEQAEDSEQFV